MQFVVCVLGLLVGPFTVVRTAVSDLETRETGIRAPGDPILLYDFLLRSVEAIIIAWIVSGFIFAYNVFVTSKDENGGAISYFIDLKLRTSCVAVRRSNRS